VSVRWPARIAASGRRIAAERAYQHARAQAIREHTTLPAAWWGLCGMLSTHQLRHGTIRPMADLWAELLPFLRIPDEALGARAVEEYLLYLDEPVLADKQWLGLQIHEALSAVDSYDPVIAELLDNPSGVFEARWMALLSYQTLLRLRRAVATYDGRFPHPMRPAYWHGTPRPVEYQHTVVAIHVT
jgi:hypothetical protein